MPSRTKPLHPRLNRGNFGAVGMALGLPLHEGGGTVVRDLSGRGNTGTLSGVTWTGGPFGRCLSFDGAGANNQGVASCGAVSALDLTLAVSLTATFQADSTKGDATWQQIAGQGGVFDGGGYLLVYNGTELRFYINGVAHGFTYAAWTGATKDAWHTATGSYDGAVIRLYGDGILQASTSMVDTIHSYGATFGLGRGGRSGGVTFVSSDQFGGLIAAAQVHTRALTAAESTALYADPFQMYRPRRRTLKGAAAVGGTGFLLRRRRLAMGGLTG